MKCRTCVKEGAKSNIKVRKYDMKNGKPVLKKTPVVIGCSRCKNKENGFMTRLSKFYEKKTDRE